MRANKIEYGQAKDVPVFPDRPDAITAMLVMDVLNTVEA